MDWPDWLFAGVLLLGLWELAAVLDAVPAGAPPRRPESAVALWRCGGAGSKERRNAMADLLFVALTVAFFVAMLGYAAACERL
jgi:ABC-type nitrate/sulfonate/bicarbonate transport system permease component